MREREPAAGSGRRGREEPTWREGLGANLPGKSWGGAVRGAGAEGGHGEEVRLGSQGDRVERGRLGAGGERHGREKLEAARG